MILEYKQITRLWLRLFPLSISGLRGTVVIVTVSKENNFIPATEQKKKKKLKALKTDLDFSEITRVWSFLRNTQLQYAFAQ